MSFRLVPQLDRSPRVISLAQRPQGKIFILAFFTLLLFLLGVPQWWLLAFYLFFFSFLPQIRWYLLLAATSSYLLLGHTDFYWERIAQLMKEGGIPLDVANAPIRLALVSVPLLFSAACVWLAGSSPLARQIKRPIFVLICLYLTLMVVASYLPLDSSIRATLWIFLIIFGRYFWFTCYSLRECRAKQPQPFRFQLGQYLPFWNPANIPYPKGSAYLKKIEATTPEQLAICQIKGLKLLMWAFWLSLLALFINVTLFGYDELFFGRLQFKREFGLVQLFVDGGYYRDLYTFPFTGVLPRYQDAFALAADGNPLPFYLNWIVLITQFLYDLLYVALTTHIIIAVIRMCGFNALRNTYKPLASANIAEFWNRYFYYFKELLVEFFFYPVFFRYFKNKPLLRMYAATLAAAFFGNFLFHFLRDIEFVLKLGFFQSLGAFHTYLFYCFLLGNVIFISQWRLEKNRHRPVSPLSRFLAPVRVLGFYCLLTIFVDFRRESIVENFAFLLSLLNIQLG